MSSVQFLRHLSLLEMIVFNYSAFVVYDCSCARQQAWLPSDRPQAHAHMHIAHAQIARLCACLTYKTHANQLLLMRDNATLRQRVQSAARHEHCYGVAPQTPQLRYSYRYYNFQADGCSVWNYEIVLIYDDDIKKFGRENVMFLRDLTG